MGVLGCESSDSATVDGQPWTEPRLTSLLNEAVSVNLISVKFEMERLRFIEEVRVGFVNSVMRAASADSLLVEYIEAVAAAPLS